MSSGYLALFDRMRRKRNDAFYDIALVTDTEAQEAVAAAEAYLGFVEADLKTESAMIV